MSVNVPSTAGVRTVQRYHPALVTLHWVIAALIFITALIAGDSEGGRQAAASGGLPILGWHMLLGITVLALLAIRLLMRWSIKRPAWATTGSAFLDRVGQWTHLALYFFAFAVTITGLILALQTNRFSRVFGMGATAPRAFNPGGVPPEQLTPNGTLQPGQARPGGGESGEGREGGFARSGRFFLGAFHGFSWTVLLLLILLHIAAALYHQFFRRDNLLGRMWFGRST